MGDMEYEEALKLGKKEYKACVSQGKFPYLPVLDDIISRENIQSEVNLGLIQIPLDFVVGTSTAGRTTAFAANFMPILDNSTEFGFKWANLADAQMTEGIRDPIIAYEYLNRFYVVEGNKRVSVLKYFDAVSISAYVTRKVPKYTDDLEIQLYYEFMKFNEITGYNTIEFTKLGNAQKLLELMGHTETWDEQVKEEFNKVRFYFQKAFSFRGGDKLSITIGDAMIAFFNVYGYENVLKMEPSDYNAKIAKAWNEIVMMGEKKSVDLVMDPGKIQEKKNILSYFIPQTPKKFTVAFLYPKAPETSDWIYSHELGRNYLEETFSDKMQTICVSDVNENNIEEVLNDVIARGASIIFEVAPQMMQHSLKVAVEHPEVKILNCSLNTPHKYIRTYYGRMYEAKFLSGFLAGVLAENDRIGYIADYPIYGMIANINAFALGASCTNPRAKIYLEWSTKKDYDRDRFLNDNDIHIVSDQDMITPKDASRMFGLYRYENGQATNLVMPLWNWGVFYEKMIQSIVTGSYNSVGDDGGRALNYWWGMSAGVVDIIFSKNIPAGVARMGEHLKSDLCKGEIVPFYGEIYAQDGTKKNSLHKEMKPEDIMEMDYLVENIVGSIPAITEFVDGAKAVVALKGVEETK